jgi:hypothetical protein
MAWMELHILGKAFFVKPRNKSSKITQSLLQKE